MKLFQEIPDLTPEQFRRFAELIHQKASINLKENKITLLSNRLRKRLRALDMDDFNAYYQLLTNSPASKEEMGYFLEVVTTNESYFWRTTQNFELLKENILPELLRTFRDETLNFWSAGCSTGEEPYNLAMELVEGMKKSGFFFYKILATDISQRVIDFAQAGRYSGRKIEKIPAVYLHRYFHRVEDKEGYHVVRPDIKQKVDFQLGYLFESKYPPQHCIFCRNVMIYFTREDQQRLANRLYDTLKPGGFLIIGHSESLHMMDTPFKARHFEKGVVYQKTLERDRA